MQNQVTVVPVDSLIMVEGEGLVFSYEAPANIHAVQWRHGSGHVEFSDGTSQKNADYSTDVEPYVTLWQEEKARRETIIPPTLEEAKQAKTIEIDATATAKITAGFWYQDESLMAQTLHFSFGSEDQSNFNSAMNGANLYLITMAGGQEPRVPSTIGWNGYTDLEHTNIVPLVFNAEQFVNFWGYAETVHKNGILTQARACKEQVASAVTVEAVQAIVWV